MDRINMIVVIVAVVFLVTVFSVAAQAQTKYRHISEKDYVDKMKGGWIGQMAGVGWGAPTEFKFCGVMIPPDSVPEWTPDTINQFRQDDIYVEMTFLRTLEVYGLDVSIRQAGIDFANSGYRLWHANRSGRDNLRNGIAPPDSGHPQFSDHADDIDYQIESDYSGLISPGMPNRVIKLGETFGRLMNYGDGVYAGQFVGGMYAESFFEKDITKIIERALEYIPPESQYAEMVRDMLEWKRDIPNNWKKTWELVEEKYRKNRGYFHTPCTINKKRPDFCIDVKLNGAYILMGLLYGDGDPDKTTVISMRCGQDSDCNPSNAAGILFTSMGLSNVPARFTSALDPSTQFSYTEYNFPSLTKTCTTLARQSVKKQGGRIEIDDNGEKTFVIPVTPITPSPLVKTWKPEPATGNRFTESEMEQVSVPTNRQKLEDQ